MIPLFIIWGISLVVGSVGVAWSIQERRKNNMRRLLEERCTKLADHVLWMEHDRSLGGEVDMALIPEHLAEDHGLTLPGGHIIPKETVREVPEGDSVDMLLDILKTAEVTGIKSEPYGRSEVDLKCHGLKPLVTLEFGDVSIRDMTILANYIPDICWKGHLLPELSGKQAQQLHGIFCNRIAQAARKSLTEPKQKATQQDVDEAVREAQIKLYKDI